MKSLIRLASVTGCSEQTLTVANSTVAFPCRLHPMCMYSHGVHTCITPSVGLTENRCLSKRPTGATLLQVGEQDVAFGAKFRAKVVLNIEEHSKGVPQRMCSNHNGSSSRSSAEEQLFPLPRSPPCDGPCSDVCFSLIEGDFQVLLVSCALSKQKDFSCLFAL